MNNAELADEIEQVLDAAPNAALGCMVATPTLRQIIAALRRSDNTAMILRCQNCGSTNVEDAKPSSDQVLVRRDAIKVVIELLEYAEDGRMRRGIDEFAITFLRPIS